jgi:hypothetical protein
LLVALGAAMKRISKGSAVADWESRQMFRQISNLGACFVAAALFYPASLVAGEKTALPQEFHARIGGFMGYTYDVHLQEGALQYSRSGRGGKPQSIRVSPTTEQWLEFRRELDAIGVWDWRRTYPNPGVADGTQWLLEVTYPDRTAKSQGSNNYPGAKAEPSGVPSGSKVFTRYLKAAERLLGGKAFE